MQRIAFAPSAVTLDLLEKSTATCLNLRREACQGHPASAKTSLLQAYPLHPSVVRSDDIQQILDIGPPKVELHLPHRVENFLSTTTPTGHSQGRPSEVNRDNVTQLV